MFRLTRLSLRNRAVIALITLGIILGGVIALGSLRTELIPSFDYPAAGVIATSQGAAPSIVQTELTEPIEAAVRGVDGIKTVTSTVSNGSSVTIAEFDYGTDMDQANEKLTTALARISRQLPDDVQTQVVTGSLSDFPIIQLAVAGADQTKLAKDVDDVLQPKLKQLDGVRSADISGFGDPRITITPDQAKLARDKLTTADLVSLLKGYGVTVPAGTVGDSATKPELTLSVQSGSALTSVADVAALPLRTPSGAVVTLADVAAVTQAAAPATSTSWLDGKDAVAISISADPDANTVNVSNEVSDLVKQLAPALAADGVTAKVAYDTGPFISDSISGLTEEGALGLGFAVIVILLFLLSIRSTVIAALSIPLSLLVAFIAMYATGDTLNLLTLSGLTIAIGRVVDDSIVVIENISRHLTYGGDKRTAIIDAVKEVGGAIAASTVCTIAVFAPIAFVGGLVGELFRSFALTLAVALAASLLVALTIVPVLSYWFMKTPVWIDEADQTHQREEAVAKERRRLWQRAYVPVLRGALHHPVVVVLIAIVILGGTAAGVPSMSTNFLGSMGMDTATVTQDFRPATSLTEQDAESKPVEAAIRGVAGVETVLTEIGSDSGLAGGTPSASYSVTLREKADADAVTNRIRDAVRNLAGTQTTSITVQGADQGLGTSTVDLQVTATSEATLATAADQVLAASKKLTHQSGATSDLAANMPTVHVDVNRAKAAAAGLTETQVSTAVAAAVAPTTLGTIQTSAGSTDVVLSSGTPPADAAALAQLPLAETTAGTLTVGDVATVSRVSEPATIERIDGQRGATISLTPKGQDLSALTSEVRTMIDTLKLPAGA
ncbi:MAG: efflux RND transporter permease subunit, partial [Bifidobacteriaceae bacterium]|nr:efflux RND transporter permease subunit [Bifidobacteriaceae bacterium]